MPASYTVAVERQPVRNEWDEFARRFMQSPRRMSASEARRLSTDACDNKEVTLVAADHYAIGAMRYDPLGPVRGRLVVAGAAGVPQGFYRRFAHFAAARGYSTLTLDYRGIGRSAPATLDGFHLNYFDWARLDLAAAVDAMSGDDLPLYMVAHSYGGQAIGLLPNHDKVAKFYTFGTGAGWYGWMPRAEQLKVLALWHVVGPLLTAWKGYLAWSLLHMGEDLPLSFYQQWKDWCRYPNNFLGDPALRHVVRRFEDVRAPIMAANAIDDHWSPPLSRDAFMAGYRNAALQVSDIDPHDLGLAQIGHLGYFRPNAKPLWEGVLRWFEGVQPAAYLA